MKNISISKRTATFELINESAFYTKGSYEIILKGKRIAQGEKNVFTLNNLEPGTHYTLEVVGEGFHEKADFTTEKENLRLDVRKFGAAGDGVRDDTLAIQTAILATPDGDTVYIPAGTYMVTSLFLKSHITVELAKGAVIKGIEDRSKYPVLPGFVETTDGRDEYYLGSWEGNPLDSYASIITGINVENIKFVGEGKLDGNASKEEWWKDAKVRRGAWRPRMIFLNNCKDITFEGITIENSPSWTVHPFYSRDLKFLNLKISNPKDSPNTDGIDPESCDGVDIVGVEFSVGDDCIAIKSSKIYMGRKLKKPSQNIRVRNCYMEHGHGGVVIGSEIAGGAKDIVVEKCVFNKTDKGLRIKTRRGRGRDSIIDGISFNNVVMEGVKVPFVINEFYFCDPDGKTEYVWSKEALLVDERTPEIRNIKFKDIKCRDAHVAGAYIYGLPEKKIEDVIFEDVEIEFAEEASKGKPAMMSNCETFLKRGLYLNNVSGVTLKNVSIKGNLGEGIILENVENYRREL